MTTTEDYDASGLHSDLTLVLRALNDADQCLTDLGEAPDLAKLVEIRGMAVEANRTLAILRDMIDNAIGEQMGKYEVIVEGAGVLRRHARKSRTKWMTDDLKRAVLDSRLVDPVTGEVESETPLDKVLDVWNLGTPRTTRLKARHIDADEFCSVEQKPGYTIEVI